MKPRRYNLTIREANTEVDRYILTSSSSFQLKLIGAFRCSMLHLSLAVSGVAASELDPHFHGVFFQRPDKKEKPGCK